TSSSCCCAIPSARWSTSTPFPPWCRPATCAWARAVAWSRPPAPKARGSRRPKPPEPRHTRRLKSGPAASISSDRANRRVPMPTQLFERSRKGEHALLIQPHAGGAPDDAELEEFSELARSAGATLAGVVTARIDRPNPATLVGSGKLEEIKAVCEATGADLVLVNHPLTPGQERNLEKAAAARGRPHRAAPGHFRPARPQPRGQAAGRTRPAQAHGHPPGARLDPPRAPARRFDRPARPGRDPARDRPPAAAEAGGHAA